MMPESAISQSENVIERSEKDVNLGLCNGTCIVDAEKNGGKTPPELVPAAVDDKLNDNSVAETSNVEVEYVDSENLKELGDVDSAVKSLLNELKSNNWVVVCEALNNVRRLSIHHKDAMRDMLSEVVPLIVKSLKNPRSGVCKTAIMASADVFSAYNDSIIESLDPLLVQLLLKSSQDKKFVCEVAENSLVIMTKSVSPTLLLPKLQPYLQNKNPRVRAKASFCFSRCVPRLGVDGIKSYGIGELMRAAASQLCDQLPESREAARALLLELQAVFEVSADNAGQSDSAVTDTWEHFCHSNLSPLNAQAVLRVTTVGRQALVSTS